MARSAALFVPTINSFGDLTLHPHGAAQASPPRVVRQPKAVGQNRVLANMLIILAFILTCLVAVTALYIIDKTAFPAAYAHNVITTTGAQVDYD